MVKTVDEEYVAKQAEYREKGLVYYTPREEIYNSVTHGLGALFGLAAAICIVILGDKTVDVIISAILYGLGVFAPYAVSTAYHGVKDLDKKRELRKFDHAGIAWIIFGNSAPMCLLYKSGTEVYYIVAASLAICIVNVVLCLVNLKKFASVALILDLVCAAVGVVGYCLCRYNISWTGKICYIIGSVLCLAGLAFYGRKTKYMHTVFHILMVFGTAVYFGALAVAL